MFVSPKKFLFFGDEQYFLENFHIFFSLFDKLLKSFEGEKKASRVKIVECLWEFFAAGDIYIYIYPTLSIKSKYILITMT